MVTVYHQQAPGEQRLVSVGVVSVPDRHMSPSLWLSHPDSSHIIPSPSQLSSC